MGAAWFESAAQDLRYALRPLPYPRSHELVDVRTRLVDGRVTTGLVSPAELELLKKMPALVERASGYFTPFEASMMRTDGSPVSVMLAGTADPVVLISAGAIVAAVTMAATIIPAMRASRLDPVRALRAE